MLNTTGDPNKNVIPVFESSTQKDVLVTEGTGIQVDNLSSANQFKFRVSVESFTDLVATLGLIAKAAGVTKSNPVLKGTVIDEINLTMGYNKAVVSQTLTNNGGLLAPALAADDESYDYTEQAVEDDIAFTLTGNDGEGQSGSIDSDVKSITFGNMMWLGYGATKEGASASGMEAFIESLQTSVLKSARAHTYFATGGANQHHFVAYPKAWGLATFFKAPFFGGYVRLKNIAGTMLSESEDTETDVLITNSAGYQEAYYIFQTTYDNQADAVTSFEIS